jgi:hypothetical protein
LRGLKNHVESFQEFHADGDAMAIAFALGLRQLNPMELWSGHRKVRRWEALAPAVEIQDQDGFRSTY